MGGPVDGLAPRGDVEGPAASTGLFTGPPTGPDATRFTGPFTGVFSPVRAHGAVHGAILLREHRSVHVVKHGTGLFTGPFTKVVHKVLSTVLFTGPFTTAAHCSRGHSRRSFTRL